MTSKELKEARKLLGLSQGQLAKSIGFTRYDQISKMERGIADIPLYVELSVRYLLLKAGFDDLPDRAM